jgi:outer membrane receptor protein involved in Fe transport
VAEPDEHRIQFTDVFSMVKGHHTFKFGGDVNIVHEVMINLFQGGGIYSYGDANTLLNFQDWIQDAFQGQPGDTDPYAGYRYNTFVQTIDKVNTVAGTQGKDDFWMKMYDVFAEDSWKLTPKFTLNAGVRYDIQLTHPASSTTTSRRSRPTTARRLRMCWIVCSRAWASAGKCFRGRWFAAATACSPR